MESRDRNLVPWGDAPNFVTCVHDEGLCSEVRDVGLNAGSMTPGFETALLRLELPIDFRSAKGP